MKITLERQIKAVKREIHMRERVYPGWVKSGRLKQHEADDELAAMQAVLATLTSLGDMRQAFMPETYARTADLREGGE